MSLIIGGGAYSLMHLFDKQFFVDLFSHVNTISDIISTFCIALIGTQSGVIVIITGLKDSYFMKLYKQKGPLDDFLFVYFLTMVCLMLTHIFSIAAFGGLIWFKIMIASMVMNICQFAFIVIVVYSVHKKAPK